VEYNTTTGCHNINTAWTDLINLSGSTEGVVTFSRGTGISEKEFKKKKIKLVISPIDVPSKESPIEFYIENLELYKAVLKTEGGTDYISPGELDQSGVITTTYNLFSPTVLDTAETVEELACEKVNKSELYTKYIPVFNENAEKVRSVTAKESNYFNILQSIAETFECWLSLEVGRSTDGAITSKVAKFKNYAGNDNYAAFRYGVNLKDIQRTYTSKDIVTKLVVKANSNKHAQDGFCTIQRAGVNPTGESYLYDF
jgi:phage minor structural protein